jgi:isomaltose glucohydrolase
MTSDVKELLELAHRSVEIISSYQDAGGAYPASPAFQVYRYCWFRDGAFIADAMSRAGSADSAERFFTWCSDVLVARAEQIEALVARSVDGGSVGREEHLPTRYTLTGEVTGEQWWDFQLDGYGTWMWALAEHSRRHGTSLERYGQAVRLSVRYLCEFWRQPCFDWWEESPEQVHPSTLGAISAGLRAASKTALLDNELVALCRATCAAIQTLLAKDGLADGHLVKSIGRTDVDASLVACLTPFGVAPPASPTAEATYNAVVRDLSPDGVHRYIGDTFYGGGRWVVLAGFVGWHEAATGRTDLALQRLRWMHAQATAEGYLPEQATTFSLQPEWVSRWEEKWGPVATPLLWSHAMYITLAHTLGLLDEETT